MPTDKINLSEPMVNSRFHFTGASKTVSWMIFHPKPATRKSKFGMSGLRKSVSESGFYPEINPEVDVSVFVGCFFDPVLRLWTKVGLLFSTSLSRRTFTSPRIFRVRYRAQDHAPGSSDVFPNVSFLWPNQFSI